jgi:hypothetical protein
MWSLILEMLRENFVLHFLKSLLHIIWLIILLLHVAFFIHVVVIQKYDYNPNMKILVRKLLVVGVFKLLANFNNHSSYTSICFVVSCFKGFNYRYMCSSFCTIQYRLQKINSELSNL